jgi:hypothetical protein
VVLISVHFLLRIRGNSIEDRAVGRHKILGGEGLHFGGGDAREFVGHAINAVGVAVEEHGMRER